MKSRTLCLLGAVAIAVLSVVACGDPGASSAPAGEDGRDAGSSDADAVVAAAWEPVLGDDVSFRSRTSGGVPFSPGVNGVYERSGDDVLEIIDSDSTTGSATVQVADTAYEWNQWDQVWDETPVDSYDPLIHPGFGFMLALIPGLFEESDGATAAEQKTASGWPGIATGWTEANGGPNGLRRFQRRLEGSSFTGTYDSADDVPVERLEEEAVTEAFYRQAEITSAVEVDAEGTLIRYVQRFVYVGDEEHPECGPLNNLVGATEQVVDFSDIGVEIVITVPTPEELVARYPMLGEAPDLSEDYLDDLNSAFTNDAGERDLDGCPTPATSPPTTEPSKSIADVQGAVDETIALAEEFDRLSSNGSLTDAVAVGQRAAEACDSLLLEELPALPDFDLLVTDADIDMILHCSSLGAAVIAFKGGEPLPNEAGDFASKIRSAWESYLAEH